MKLVFRRLQFVLLFVVVACNLVACNNAPSSPTPNPNALTVAISSPTGTAYTNGTLNLQIVVGNGTPESVELLKGDEVLVSNLAVPYTYAWNTSSEAEGGYTLKARAKRGTEVVESEKTVTVVVDRTAPTIAERTPAPGADNVLYSAPITVKFSEPISASTVTSANIQLVANNLPVSLAPTLESDGLTLNLQAVKGGIKEFDTQPELTLSKITDRAGNELLLSSWGWTLPSWLTVGGTKVNDLENSAVSLNPDGLELDASDHPVLVVNERVEIVGSNKSVLYVKRWTGTQWQRLGDNLKETDFASSISHTLALDSSDNPYVSWEAVGGTVQVARWNGSAWGVVGSILNQNPAQQASPISLSLDTSGNPVLAFTEETSTTATDKKQLYVKRWTGSSWELLGTGSLNQNIDFDTFSASLALDASGNPVVTWTERGNNTFDIYVKRWTGTAWQLLGSDKLNNQPTGLSPSLVLDASGQPVVAYVEGTPGFNHFVYVKKFDGTNWQFVGSSAAELPSVTFNVSLALDNAGRPVVHYPMSTNAHFKRFDGTNWQEFVKPISSVSPQSLVLDSEGYPFITVTRENDISTVTTSAFVLQANH